MAGRLAQSQQRLQHLDLGFRQALRGHRLQQRIAVVQAQFVVELALRGLQLAEEGLLGFGRKLARHLLLGAPQNERAQRVGQQDARFRAGVARRASGQLEHAGRAHHAGVEKFENAP